MPVPPGAEVISTDGMSVLPGLWDMHVHLMLNGHSDYAHWDKTYLPKLDSIIMPASAKQLLLAGVTSARDLGAPLDASISVRDRINKGTIHRRDGLRLGSVHPARAVSGHGAVPLGRQGRGGRARAKVRKLADAGVDVIKLIDQDQMTIEEMRAVVDEAHRRNLPVVGHAHRPEEIRRGHRGRRRQLRAHRTRRRAGVSRRHHHADSRARGQHGSRAALLDARRSKVSSTTSTSATIRSTSTIRRGTRGCRKDIVEDIRKSVEHPERLDYFRATPSRRPTLARKFQQLREAGVTLLIGTDSGIPMKFHSGSTWRELDAWVNLLGVDPMTTIRAATFWPAVAMRKEREVGTISPGKYADIIAVKGDVLRYIAFCSASTWS